MHECVTAYSRYRGMLSRTGYAEGMDVGLCCRHTACQTTHYVPSLCHASHAGAVPRVTCRACAMHHMLGLCRVLHAEAVPLCGKVAASSTLEGRGCSG